MSDEFNNVDLAAELTIAWLSNPSTRAGAEDVPAFLQRMHEAVAALNAPAQPEAAADAQPEYTPAVGVRKSLASPDHIISMIDGKPYRTLRRHLSTNGLTPEQYRERYNLKADYPMVAPSYAETRRALAHKIGLGRKAKAVEEAVAEAVKPVAKRARKTVSDAKKAAQSHLGGGEQG